MPTQVDYAPPFDKSLRNLAKQYRGVRKQVDAFIQQLEADDRPGDQIPGVGYEVYKVRLPNPDAQRGKSGGFRVIYYVQLADKVLLLIIYSKTQTDDIPVERLREIIENFEIEEDDKDEENRDEDEESDDA